MSIPNSQNLSLWDRFFNRYRKEIHQRGTSTHWNRNSYGESLPNSVRSWVEYRVIDRLTGSETIERDYLN